MANVLPRNPVERVTFLENHVAGWATNAVAIGSSAPAITSLTTLVTSARAAYNAQQVALQAAKVATQAWNDAAAAMSRSASDVLKQIKAKAATGGNAIYNLAQIPAPATPGPVPPPGQPTDFKVVLNADGSLNLKWKCPNPASATGISYQVCRRTGITGPFAFIGATGTRSFIDPTVPAGTPCVTYKIQPFRTTASGPVAEFLVNFGTGAGSGEAMVTIASAPKLAA